MLADVLHVGKAAEHTTVVVGKTRDTIRAVLDVLCGVCSAIVQLDGLGNVERTIEVEVVLAVL